MKRMYQSCNIRMSTVFKILLIPAIYKTLTDFPLFLCQIKFIKGILCISLIITIFFLSLYKQTAIYSNIRDYVTPEKSSLNE